MVTRARQGRLMRQRRLPPVSERFSEDALRAMYGASGAGEEDTKLATLGLAGYAECLRRIAGDQE